MDEPTLEDDLTVLRSAVDQFEFEHGGCLLMERLDRVSAALEDLEHLEYAAR